MEARPVGDGHGSALVDWIVRRREFVFTDCLVVGGRVYEYGWDAERLLLGGEVSVDSGEYGLAGFAELGRLDVGSITYSFGSTMALRSSGYFMKMVGDRLAWLLVCTDSEAFTDVVARRDGVEFVSRLGERWVVPAEDVTAVFVEAPGARADLSWPPPADPVAPGQTLDRPASQTAQTGPSSVWYRRMKK